MSREAKSATQGIVQLMGQAIRHRGPDYSGDYGTECGAVGLVCERLSIVDVAHGRQPVSNEPGTVQVVANGEIYNHLRLRRELESKGHRLPSGSDVEVLPHLYEEHGLEFLEHLEGMFAIALWDGSRRRLVLARDRFGIKPLYYRWSNQTLWFASEIKALCAHPDFRARLNPAALVDYVSLQYTLGDHTFFEGVRRLMPGHRLVLDADTGSLRVEPYWRLDYASDLVDHERTEAATAAELRELIGDSVAESLPGEVPWGCYLSGGLDSSTVTSFAARSAGTSPPTFSAGFLQPGFDETGYAALMAEEIGSERHQILPTAQQFGEFLPALIYQMDEPAAGPGLVPQFLVAQLAARSVKVVLSGLGGDEIAGGYVRYLAALIDGAMRDAIYGSSTSGSGDLARYSGGLSQLRGYEPLLGRLGTRDLAVADDAQRYFALCRRGVPSATLSADLIRTADRDSLGAFREAYERPASADRFSRMLHVDAQGMLPALLQVEDRVSMSVGLESRVPLLDHRIAEFLATVPTELKIRGGELRYIYRQAVADVLPPAIAERRTKMGLPVPVAEWFGGALRDFVGDVAFSTRARDRGIINQTVFDMKNPTEGPYGRNVWGLLCIELWCQAYLDGDVNG